MAQINKPNTYFNTVTWTGTNDATTSVTGVNFQPDFVWIKNRNVADDHTLHDAIRGSTKTLFSNSTGAEGTNTESIQSFDSDGFTTGNHRGTGGSAGNLMVSWNWLASNTTASNADGSITSTVSANTTSGFSIVSYTGTGSPGTVGHGLGTTPSMIIVKDRTTAGEYWHVYHKSLGATKAVYLNTTDASVTTSGSWNDTSPTSTVFSNGTLLDTTSTNFIAYCFAEKKGFSKFGSYTGNGSSDGTFVYTGFKPAFVIIKNANNGAEEWGIWDNKRNTYNILNKRLVANISGAENTADYLDFTSNGFKVRNGTLTQINGSGYTYIYAAFAENPFQANGGLAR